MGIYVKVTKTTYEIWSCHVTVALNSDNVSFSPDFVLNFRKRYQIWGKLAQEPKSYRQKQIGGGNTPPPSLPLLIGLNVMNSFKNTTVSSCSTHVVIL